jgi:tRNA dimethylallyltransferase
MSTQSNNRTHGITFVVGPTAVGKSELALSMAVDSGAAIVNADSIQCYKQLDIGAAKPSREDMNLVTHFLYGFVVLTQHLTAGDYRRAALQVIEEQISHRSLIFVGGSGFYFQALEKGMFDVGPISESIRAEVQEVVKSDLLYKKLTELDPAAALKIGPQDLYRLERALELVLSEKKTLVQIESDFKAKHQQLGDLYPLKKIGLFCERDRLKARVTQRTQKMLKMGLVDEVQSLFRQGFQDARPLQSVGYREVGMFLRGEIPQSELLPAIVTSTMQLAKKQRTWFQRDKQIEWREVR